MRSYCLPAMRGFRLILLMLLSLVVGLPARAMSSSADAPHVHVQLVIPEKQLSTAEGNEAGLYFKLEAGWHIYWKNPGDAGEPPHIHWTLPAGITAGALQFPAPKRLPLGPLMDFGYENQAVFPFDFVVGPSAKAGPSVLHAKVDWLVCREACIPGKADLEEDVRIVLGKRVPGQFSYSDYALMDWSIKQLPLPQPPEYKAVFRPTVSGFRLEVDARHRRSQAEFFPEDPDILDNPAPQKLTPTANGLILDLKKDANLTANPAQLKGVLELSGGRAYEIARTVRAQVRLPQSKPQGLKPPVDQTALMPGLKPRPTIPNLPSAARPLRPLRRHFPCLCCCGLHVWPFSAGCC